MTPMVASDSRFLLPDRTTVSVRTGRLGDTADRLAERPPAGELVLDLCGVTAVGSRDLGALAALHRAVQAAGGTLRLVNVGRPVLGVLAASRLNTFLFVIPGGSTVG